MLAIPVQIPKNEKLIGSAWITCSPLIHSAMAMGEPGRTIQKELEG